MELLHWTRVGFEIFLIAICYMVILLYRYGVVPLTRRGFFCDDESIRYPYSGETISNTLVLISSYSITIILILITEFVKTWKIKGIINVVSISAWIQNFYKYLMGFLFSMAMTSIIQHVASNAIGRLRPCFLSLCQPEVDFGNCSALEYITHFSCTAELESFARQSFFSGHAAVSSCSAVYAVLYIFESWPWNWNFIKSFLSFLIILQAVWIGLTRIKDNVHFPLDVGTGLIVGSGIAFLTATYVVGLGGRIKTCNREFERDEDTNETRYQSS